MAFVYSPGQLARRASFYQQLASLTAAGVTLVSALETLHRAPPAPSYRSPIQAVLAQSMSLRHWLMPISQALTTALAGGLGVVLAAAQADRKRRLLLLAAIIVVALPLSWQLAISQLWLLPLALPLAALVSTALLRRD